MSANADNWREKNCLNCKYGSYGHDEDHRMGCDNCGDSHYENRSSGNYFRGWRPIKGTVVKELCEECKRGKPCRKFVSSCSDYPRSKTYK